MKPSKAHLDTAQRIYDRLGRGSVADIDAIASALAEAERKERERCASIAKSHAFIQPNCMGYDAREAGYAQSARAILSTIQDESE